MTFRSSQPLSMTKCTVIQGFEESSGFFSNLASSFSSSLCQACQKNVARTLNFLSWLGYPNILTTICRPLAKIKCYRICPAIGHPHSSRPKIVDKKIKAHTHPPENRAVAAGWCFCYNCIVLAAMIAQTDRAASILN